MPLVQESYKIKLDVVALFKLGMETLYDLYDKLDHYTMSIAIAEKEYHSYVKLRGWSDSMCARVDVLKKLIRDNTVKIAEIQEKLR